LDCPYGTQLVKGQFVDPAKEKALLAAVVHKT